MLKSSDFIFNLITRYEHVSMTCINTNVGEKQETQKQNDHLFSEKEDF